ncbi:MAG: heme oxygenase [Chlamydiales bacterium]|jgi:heme oxygenase
MSIPIDPSQRSPSLLQSLGDVNHPEERVVDIVKGINEKIMAGGPMNRSNLHAKVSGLPFYKRLTDGTISPHELVQHFVNQKKIFGTLETLIKADEIFNEIISEDIFRAETIEKDISYFEEQFHLIRPRATKETEDFVSEIQQKVAAEKTHLLAYTYVQYVGLFLGRSIAGKTEKWLEKNVENYSSENPSSAGLAYWQFTNMESPELRRDYQKALVAFYSTQSLDIEKKEALIELGERAFIHNGSVLESVKPLQNRKWTLMGSAFLGVAAAGVAASFLMRKYFEGGEV